MLVLVLSGTAVSLPPGLGSSEEDGVKETVLQKVVLLLTRLLLHSSWDYLHKMCTRLGLSTICHGWEGT